MRSLLLWLDDACIGHKPAWDEVIHGMELTPSRGEPGDGGSSPSIPPTRPRATEIIEAETECQLTTDARGTATNCVVISGQEVPIQEHGVAGHLERDDDPTGFPVRTVEMDAHPVPPALLKTSFFKKR